jgi:hypothetical protein
MVLGTGRVTIRRMDRCRLQYTVGRIEACPEEPCPFWEGGRAVLEGGCVFDQLDIGDNPELAAWLLRIRKRLEAAKTVAEDPRALRLFYRLSSPA